MRLDEQESSLKQELDDILKSLETKFFDISTYINKLSLQKSDLEKQHTVRLNKEYPQISLENNLFQIDIIKNDISYHKNLINLYFKQLNEQLHLFYTSLSKKFNPKKEVKLQVGDNIKDTKHIYTYIWNLILNFHKDIKYLDKKYETVKKTQNGKIENILNSLLDKKKVVLSDLETHVLQLKNIFSDHSAMLSSIISSNNKDLFHIEATDNIKEMVLIDKLLSIQEKSEQDLLISFESKQNMDNSLNKFITSFVKTVHGDEHTKVNTMQQYIDMMSNFDFSEIEHIEKKHQAVSIDFNQKLYNLQFEINKQTNDLQNLKDYETNYENHLKGLNTDMVSKKNDICVQTNVLDNKKELLKICNIQLEELYQQNKDSMQNKFSKLHTLQKLSLVIKDKKRKNGKTDQEDEEHLQSNLELFQKDISMIENSIESTHKLIGEKKLCIDNIQKEIDAIYIQISNIEYDYNLLLSQHSDLETKLKKVNKDIKTKQKCLSEKQTYYDTIKTQEESESNSHMQFVTKHNALKTELLIWHYILSSSLFSPAFPVEDNTASDNGPKGPDSFQNYFGETLVFEMKDGKIQTSTICMQRSFNGYLQTPLVTFQDGLFYIDNIPFSGKIYVYDNKTYVSFIADTTEKSAT